ncbi:bacteriophage protein GP46, Mu-like protein [Cupriavidus necator N-1]|uniref:Bacteriophage protein GP46, Mu-like protein n=1 Tax=Cupriavidus necator (strain ATCC 43291 / DSM 13513 / CCUG 52238 / LMG 8453 / N-1) TaxID=1042878 RepID=G0ER39_CUPNN|nr:phage GP46 family protein [Cupriavidus necator]AEI76557.1 bacteriophage protein GP46, Mu-like protein [Cupriavidus necator N-1]MDX6011320.1 phage GP46 family protein [Cupriavidus necator]
MDIELFWSTDLGRCEWRQRPDGQLAVDHDLKTAVLISLFTWRRAEADDILPDPRGPRRGWWGDLLAARPIGSRLWLLSREKQTAEVVRRAREYAEEALAWLLDDGVCASVEVITEIVQTGMLGLRCRFTRPDGTAVAYQFDFAWRNLSNVTS